MKSCDTCPLRASCVEVCPELEAQLPKEHDGRDRFMRNEMTELSLKAFREQQMLHDAYRAYRDHLMASQLEAFERYYIDGLSVRAIAEEVGTSPAAVAQRLRSGRERLLRLAERGRL
ncbi:MAG: sigma-70 family RNA polymerase sigma factor [Planctomycetes bacterium]|nr:sigma-70 family RNA polymerase sigma factor [Planctomycetota bacterium]